MTVRPNGLTYPCFWIYPDARKLWRWVFYAVNGEEIAVSSESYVNLADCRHGVTLMQLCGNAQVFLPRSAAA